MIYGSICSGIESASIAWEPLGMRAAWFAEVEAFPSAVLAHHWPGVANLGDMCNLPYLVATGLIDAPDILVGGTPCQAFSVAGLRKGLGDERGQLTLKFVELANEIDKKRKGNECITVWENVPGVLSSKDNAFGCFLGALAGEECELKPTGLRWSNAGLVFGPERTIAWRVLDAQYFGVAQRRRRVFVVASARKGFDPSKVLFESEGLRRDTPPSREAGEEITGSVKNGSHWDNRANAHPTLNQSFNTGGIGASNQEVFSQRGAGLTLGATHPKEIANTLTRRMDKGVNSDLDEGQSLVYPIHDKATRHAGKTGKGSGNGFGVGSGIDPCPTLTTGDKHAVCTQALKSVTMRLTASYGTGGADYDTKPLVFPEVRKLTPVECERLQGFPDNHTRIPWRNKSVEDCPDGPRYKAIGNSKAVPVIKFIGGRILKELNK